MSEPFVTSLVKIFLLFAGTTIALQLVIGPLGRRFLGQLRACWNRDFMEISKINPESFRPECSTESERCLIVVTRA